MYGGNTFLPLKVNYGTPESGHVVFKLYFRIESEFPQYGAGIFAADNKLEIPAYSDVFSLVSMNTEPSDPQTIFEGQSLDYSCELSPRPGLGTGSIGASGGEMDFLEGYRVTNVEPVLWYHLKIYPEKPEKREGYGWEYKFTPDEGIGTYVVKNFTSVYVKEQETGAQTTLYGKEITPVTVLPGLKINSPIASFVYPLGYPIKVETSLDDNPEEWKKIQWFLNGQPWAPDPNEPKQKLVIENPGEYHFKAAYKNPENIDLSQELQFSVKPVQVSISPQRKVTAYSQGLNVPLQAKVEFVGKPPIENSENPLDLENGVTAIVSKVNWQVISNPTGGVTTKLEKNLLAPNLEFGKDCAVTALATVTVYIYKTVKTQSGGAQKTRVVNETFVFPAIRADLWAVKNPSWSKLNGHFPERAIAFVGRTFEFQKGEFELENQTFNWSFKESFGGKPVVLNPALDDKPILPAVSSEVSFHWVLPDGQVAEENPKICLFEALQKQTLQIKAFLHFGSDGRIPFTPWKHEVTVVPINSLLEAVIKPEGAFVQVGYERGFTCRLRSLEHPNPEPEMELEVLKGAYKVKIGQPAWSVFPPSGPAKREIISPEFNYAPVVGGVHEIQAIPPIFYREDQGIAEGTINPFTIKTKFTAHHGLKIRLTTGETAEKFTLSYKGKTKFQAFIKTDKEEPMVVDWRLSGGDVAEDSERGKLLLHKLWDVKKGNLKIGVLPGSNTVHLTASETEFTSIFSSMKENPLKLIATRDDLSASAILTLKQPTVRVHFNVVKDFPYDGEQALSRQIEDWASAAKRIWGKEDLIKIEVDDGYSWVDNATFTPLPETEEKNSEKLFLTQDIPRPIELLSPLVFDRVLQDFYQPGIPTPGMAVVPRQSEELIEKKHIDSIANVYITRSLYRNVGNPGKLEIEAWGSTFSSDDCVRRSDLKNIDDSKESGIFLGWVPQPKPSEIRIYNRVLAHECGHLLIQYGDEHATMTLEYLMAKNSEGEEITEMQYWYALDYEGTKPFITESNP